MKNKAVYAILFAPHPLDPELGMGGTVAQWTQQGKDIVYVICTNGDKGSSDPNMMPEQLAKIRELEQLEAAKMLRVNEVIFLRHPDLGLEESPEFKKEILKLILGYRPEIVCTCDPYQRYLSNRDHRITGRVVMDAVWPTAQAPNTYRDLLDQGFQLHKVKEVFLWQTEDPNYRNDITKTFDLKKAALGCHKSQIGSPMVAWFTDFLMELTTAAAKNQGYKFGEAFHRMEVLQRL